MRGGVRDAAGSAGIRVGSTLALHDAQSVIVREYGFASWALLRQTVEERENRAPMQELVRALDVSAYRRDHWKIWSFRYATTAAVSLTTRIATIGWASR